MISESIPTGLLRFITSTASTARCFGVPNGTGAMMFYDGQGVVQEVLPAMTTYLNDVWASPSGEVFGVGMIGHIVRGP